MSIATGDAIALAIIVVAGPWGIVLIVALVRGYDLRVSMRRRRERERRRDDDDTP